MIELRNVSKSFDGRQILKNVNLTIPTGERIAIIGASGCGKSTMLRLIMGLHKPDSGEVLVFGENIHQVSKARLLEIRLKIGILFQSAALFDSMNVAENVAFPLIENFHMPAHKVATVVAKKLELVEMTGFDKNDPADLSGGQRKRIGLARALSGDPEIMLYDEPTTGLDPILSTNIEDLIVRLSRQLKVTSIVVTHQISTILRTADKIYMVNQGTLLPPESPDTIMTADSIYGEFVRGGLS
jgi:phospholipid/cholesterol/gamma-HCH transport system ATP-binding protein